MCKCSCETNEQILLHCLLAKEVWSSVFTAFRVILVLRRQVIDFVCCVERNVLAITRTRCLASYSAPCLIWTIWRGELLKAIFGGNWEEFSWNLCNYPFFFEIFVWILYLDQGRHVVPMLIFWIIWMFACNSLWTLAFGHVLLHFRKTFYVFWNCYYIDIF